MDRIPEELKISLASARVNARLTQREVAEKLGVSNVTIVNWENGRSSPNIVQANILYDLYRRPKDSIIF